MSDRNTYSRRGRSTLFGLILIIGMILSAIMFLFSFGQTLFSEIAPIISTSTPQAVVKLPTLTATPIPNTPTPEPTLTPTPQPETATPSDPNDSGWQTIRPGLEIRERALVNNLDGNVVERLTIFRLDPNQFRFDVGYSPGSPRSLDGWLLDSDALVVMNAGYFTAENVATGLTVSQGQPSGSSYAPFAGMVAIGGTEPSSAIDVRWLNQTPYNPAEQLWGAFQSFPVLVHSGGTAAFPAGSDNGDRSRRSVIGQDKSGNLILLTAGRGGLTLSEFSEWLALSDLDLEIAVNLDGGTSTGMLLNHPDKQIRILPFVPLPTVLLVYER